MRNDFCSNYLAHHGIQGQKWGIKNGPPYPLDSSSKSSSEKKQSKEKFHLSNRQKTYLAIGAAVAVGALAAYGTYKLGGPAGVSKLARRVSQSISLGKKASKPYMKMNLQYFAKKKRKSRISLPRDPSKYRSLRPDEFPPDAHYGVALQEAINNHRDKIKSGKAFAFSHGNYTYVIVGDGEGYSGRIIECVRIAGAVTGLYKRDPYVK